MLRENLMKLERRITLTTYVSVSVYACVCVCVCLYKIKIHMYVVFKHACVSAILLELRNLTAKIIFYAQSGYLFAFVFIIISIIGSTSKYRNSWLIPTFCLVWIYREGNNTYLIYSSLHFLTNHMITILEWYQFSILFLYSDTGVLL